MYFYYGDIEWINWGFGLLAPLDGYLYYSIGGIKECLNGTWVIGATLGRITGKGWSFAGKDYSY